MYPSALRAGQGLIKEEDNPVVCGRRRRRKVVGRHDVEGGMERAIGIDNGDVMARNRL
jgi:hypothetical protein